MWSSRSAQLLILSLLGAACAPQSVSRDVVLGDAEAPGPGDAGPAPPAIDAPVFVDARAATTAGAPDTRLLDAPVIAPPDAARPADRPPDGGPAPTIDPEALPPPPDAAIAPTALLVVGTVMPLAMGDDKLKLRLEENGLTVRVGPATGPATQASGVALVVISGTGLGADVAAKYAAVAVPVICLEPVVFGRMRLTADADTAQGSAAATQIVVTAAHPIVAGLTGTIAVTTAQSTLGWGLPATTASRIATVGTMANRYAVFAYDKGAMLVGMPATPAPARRVGLFIRAGIADRLTPAGWRIFDGAVDWALARRGR
jgi:hypothetical protein